MNVKPWDDETDMKAMEAEVRKITCDGLLWGAGKIVFLIKIFFSNQLIAKIKDNKLMCIYFFFFYS